MEWVFGPYANVIWIVHRWAGATGYAVSKSGKFVADVWAVEVVAEPVAAVASA